MSDTRPPITAGPIERAFKFLNSTSVSCGVVGEGAGVTLAESGGVVLAGDAIEEVPVTGGALGGVSSCAGRNETKETENNETHERQSREIIGG